MFAYCLNNPVNLSDTNGAISFFSICLCDNGNNNQIVDYVIAYYNQNSQSNLDGLAYGQQYSSEAIYVDDSSYSDFVNAMNSVPNRHVNNIYIYIHSDYDSNKEAYRFVFYYAKYSYAENILSDISSLSIQGDIYLFSCHGANLAPSLAQATGENVVASYEGVSFSRGYARIGTTDRIKSWLFGDDTRGWWLFSPSGDAKQLTQERFLYGG